MRPIRLFPFSLLVISMGLFLPAASGQVVINEIMYNPDDNEQGRDDYYEWVEVHNTGSGTVNLSGWKLRDEDPTNPPFVIPSNTEIGPGGYLVICRNFSFIYLTYGITNAVGNFAGNFRLGNEGDTVTLLDAYDSVVDQVTYNDHYPWPFQPDGGGPSLERINPLAASNDPHNWAGSIPASEFGTPGRENSLFSDGTAPPVAINEIHYHPASNSGDEEYVELLSTSDTPVDLGGWKFTNGISFEFPVGTTVDSSDPLVVCKNEEWIRANYEINNVIGDFAEDSSLDNAGETIVLRDAAGRLVDFVAYADEEYWPILPDGHGPSLECINPNLPNNDAANWTSGPLKQKWVHLESPAALPTGDLLYIYLNGEGEVLLDDVALLPEGGGDNLIPNGDFEAGDAGWVKYGNHSTSARIATAAHSGTACMKLVSTGDGGGGEWRNYIGITIPGISVSQRYILSLWARPVSGETRLTARLANSRATEGISITADIARGGFVSTPGSQNEASAGNIPPFIYHVQHSLSVPTSGNSVTIVAAIAARVRDFEEDGSLSSAHVSSVRVEYAIGEEWFSVPMYDDGLHDDDLPGDGEFGAQLPGQPCFSIVRYRIVAEDDQGAVSLSPDPDDLRSTYAYFCHDTQCYGDGGAPTLPVYFLYVSDENLLRLEQLGSRDDYVPATFVYDGHVYDGVSVRWYGSFSERVATRKRNWRVRFNPWETMDGLGSLILLGGDYDDPKLRGSASLREALTQQVFRYTGCAYSETQYVLLQLNNSYYGLTLRIERPDTDYLERNRRDRDGDLFQAQSLPGQPPSNMSVLSSYDDYVFAYDRKTNRLEPHDTLISLIEGLETTPEDQMQTFLEENLDVEKYASYLAGVAMAQNWISPARDYYLFSKSVLNEASELQLAVPWEVMPWGGEHNWERPTLPVLNGTVGQNEYSLPNLLATRFLAQPALQEQFATRLRQLLDTTFTEPHLFSVLTLLQSRIRTAAETDRSYWWPEADSLARHVAALKTNVSARRDFLYRWLDGIEGPNQPENGSPADGAPYVSDPVTLVATEFFGIPGSTHQSSQWQIRDEEGLYSSAIWDSGEDPANTTSVTVPSGMLPEDRTYFWRVRYKDDANRWSLWSDETSFTVRPDTIPPSIVSVFCLPEVDDEVAVAFSEPVDPVSAENTSNYLLNDTESPTGVSLSPDGLTLTLSVSPGTPLYSLTVSDIADRALPPNVIPPGTKVSIQVWASYRAKINFQPESEPVPSGYTKDTGAPFDDGRGYGWTTAITDLALVRNVQADPRLDTILPFGGGDCAWELAVSSPAKYRVTVCIGDAASDSIYNLAIEGIRVVSGLYLPANEFREVTAEVDVTDGRLTLYGGDVYRSTRVAYLHVLSGASVFRVTNLAPNGADPDWLDITWPHSEGADYRIHWAEGLASWNAFTPSPGDMIIDGQAGTVTWTDKGTSPGMGGVAPGQAAKRFYRVELLTQ